MPKCENCGSHVTRRYVRVFCPQNGGDIVRCCPKCHKIRDGTEVRDKRYMPPDAKGGETA